MPANGTFRVFVGAPVGARSAHKRSRMTRLASFRSCRAVRPRDQDRRAALEVANAQVAPTAPTAHEDVTVLPVWVSASIAKRRVCEQISSGRRRLYLTKQRHANGYCASWLALSRVAFGSPLRPYVLFDVLVDNNSSVGVWCSPL